ncbi:glucuronate isomerase [Streptomyces cavernicola]|uniref:Uronate isomerase n=1 Tax=Streptomyces cavernicola TaxID=3043613 RepID=A0ABT6S7J0_9ACTN|nr:glucuronate isomerase [Streptomyces sp. B-S-A6]MDI3403403.1 glucuronate isomerase [Streptomyces sp. B-S-A6]
MPRSTSPLQPHPDRLFPADPGVRAIARRLYEAVRELPIISPHGHVDPRLLLTDEPFRDPASLLVTPDHYVTRMLHASGVPLAELGVGRGPLPEPEARVAWRHLCANWAAFRGTPVRYWFDAELSEIFGITERPDAGNADRLYDQIAEQLTQDKFRPRALFQQFGIEVLATTDDPCDDLSAHRALADDPSWSARVIPTFRPDRYLEPAQAGWRDAVTRLGEVSGVDTGTYVGFLCALEARRRHFVEHGATSADHSHLDVRAEPLPADEAQRIYAAALAGTATAAEATAFRRNMLFEMARMSTEDGLVMTLHPAVHRNHHTPTYERFGADTGHDIPVQVEFTQALQPMLTAFGTHPGFRLVLFTLDETVFSREIAPLAGFYPSVYAGAPWWFLDAPDAIRRYRRAVTETAGFSRTSGFIDDTRAFCSIPARHDMSRRLDSGVLAELVAEHRLDEDEALETAVALVADNPRKAFKL